MTEATTPRLKLAEESSIVLQIKLDKEVVIEEDHEHVVVPTTTKTTVEVFHVRISLSCKGFECPLDGTSADGLEISDRDQIGIWVRKSLNSMKA